ncbi:MAG: hypothetical protein KDA61_12985, partial [Planctomycetales bacterium]|nr:hypothetical protein [Planctomycetales bacterium]
MSGVATDGPPHRAEVRATRRGAESIVEVGRRGTGRLDVLNGGLVATNGLLAVGPAAGSSGDVFIAGAAQGFPAEVTAANGVQIGAGGDGSVAVAQGGRLETSTATVYAGGRLDITGGTLDIDALDLSNNLGALQMTGGVLHANRIEGDLAPIGGVVAPGRIVDAVPDGIGTTTINGDFTLGEDAVLAIEIAGPTAGLEHDYVVVDAVALLEGTLSLSFTGGYVPHLGDVFTILTAHEAVRGELAHQPLWPTLDPTLRWDVRFAAQDVSVAVVPRLAGDFNADGTVDDDDFAIWQAEFGEGVGADANGDGR